MIPLATAKGFTLIEMLIVLMIMGLLIGMVAAIAQPDDRALLRVEVERLAQLMDLAATESRLTGKSYAWTTDGSGYRFWKFGEDSGWAEIVDDGVLHARTLPPGMAISNLRVENARALEFMRVEFDPNGAALAFTLEMSFGVARFTVANSPLGEVRVLSGAGKVEDEPALR